MNTFGQLLLQEIAGEGIQVTNRQKVQ